MEKILITFEVPSVALKFDALVPGCIMADQLRELLYPILEQLSGGVYIPSGEEVLWRKDKRRLLPLGITLEDMGIEAGERLILF